MGKSANKMNSSSVKADDVKTFSLRDGEGKHHRLFEKIVYFVSGSIGDEVSMRMFTNGTVNFSRFFLRLFIGTSVTQEQ